jgi:hypothetical protein
LKKAFAITQKGYSWAVGDLEESVHLAFDTKMFSTPIAVALGFSLFALGGCNTAQQTLDKFKKQEASMAWDDSFAINVKVDMTSLPKTVCLEQRPDNEHVAELFRKEGWTTRPKIDPTCRVLVVYNHQQPEEIMQKIYRLERPYRTLDNEYGTGGIYRSTEKCSFRVPRDPNFKAIYSRVRVIGTEPNSFENCALRTMIAVEGYSGAMIVKDKEIARVGSEPVESRLKSALALAKEGDKKK